MSETNPIPTEHTDPINSQILAVSEDQVAGFHARPFDVIADKSGIPLETVLTRIRTMLEAGVIRRVRQTLLATNLAEGALVAWEVDDDKLESTFDFMVKNDPFSGHVVLRSTDRETCGANYKLWTTLKVPQGSSLQEHGDLLRRVTGAHSFRLMPAKGIFALGVGHVRRKSLAPGDRVDQPAKMSHVGIVKLNDIEWKVLLALKAELTPDEVRSDVWDGRAARAKLPLDEFLRIAADLDSRKVIGRFSTFLEHVKPSSKGVRVTRFNGLFHWAVPPGMEERAGGEIGRHLVLTHCYWREGGPDFGNVNIMAVAHGGEKELVLKHKAAIDKHIEEAGIPVTYTNIFWGGRSEIKPSEISPHAYAAWRKEMEGRG